MAPMATGRAASTVTDTPNNNPPNQHSLQLYWTAPYHAPLVSQFWMTARPNDGQATNYLFPKVKLNGYTGQSGSEWTLIINIVLQLKGC